jgi:hypothetical protein
MDTEKETEIFDKDSLQLQLQPLENESYVIDACEASTYLLMSTGSIRGRRLALKENGCAI